MSDNRIISTSKATDKPSYTILVSNEEISKEIHVQLIVISKLVNKISQLKLIIFDGEPSKESFEVSNKDLFVPGNTLEIQAGYHSDESSIFKGIIIKHALKTVENKSSQLIVECKHEAVKMIYGRMNACYSEVKDSDIFDTIITKYSIKKDIDTTNVKHKQLVQYNCSDWDFIISRVEMNGLNVYTNDDTISIKKPDYSKEPELTWRNSFGTGSRNGCSESAIRC